MLRRSFYRITPKDGYLYLRVSGKIPAGGLIELAADLQATAKAHQVYRVFVDTRGVQLRSITLQIQIESVKTLWQIRHAFRKIAFYTADERLYTILLAVLRAGRPGKHFLPFNDQRTALAWLTKDAGPIE